MIHEETQRYIDALPDEQLYVYATDTDGIYSEDAVAYAKQVLDRRHVNPAQLAALAQLKTERDGDQAINAGPTTCPVCMKPIAEPRQCKTLYDVKVCNKCRNGFANRRQAAFVVDFLVYCILLEAATSAVYWINFDILSRPIPIHLLHVNLLPLALLLVFTFKDAFYGRSLGKMLFRVRVVDATTREPITPAQSFKRNLILTIPYVGVIGSAITMMRGQRWGDKWANTMVLWNKYAFRQPFAPPGHYCRGCGYDLTGNVSGRCPECGLEIALPTTSCSGGLASPGQ